MGWFVAVIILLVALMIPILAIVMDSPVVRHWMEARQGLKPGQLADLSQKVSALEDQIDDLNRTIESIREEQQFLQQLLENPDRQAAAKRLPPAP